MHLAGQANGLPGAAQPLAARCARADAGYLRVRFADLAPEIASVAFQRGCINNVHENLKAVIQIREGARQKPLDDIE